MTIIHSQFTPEEVKVYKAAIQEGLQERIALRAGQVKTATLIGTVRDIGGNCHEVIFDTSHSRRSHVHLFRYEYTISRQDFYKNLGDALLAVPRVLAHPMMSLMTRIFARLLRVGNAPEALDRTGTPFFATDKFGATGNLHHNTLLTRAAVDAGIDEMAVRGVTADTLIVPPALYGAAVQSVEMNNHVVSGASGAVVKHSETSRIKRIILLPELDEGAPVAATRTWYLASCLGPNGPRALYGAVEEGFELLTSLNVGSKLPDIAWMGERRVAFDYGNAAYINRYEQGDPSSPSPDDVDWLNRFTTDQVLWTTSEEAIAFCRDKEDSSYLHTESLTELITKVAKLTGIDADKIAARIEKTHS